MGLIGTIDLTNWLEKVEALVNEAADLRPLYPAQNKAPDLRLHGKQVRARLLLQTAGLLGVLDDRAAILAAAVELVHNASLFHDDVIDQARLRRGAPALHTVVGGKQAVMTGDVCFAKGMELICRVNLEPVYHTVSRAVVDLASGQLAESAHWGDAAMTLDRYFFIVDRKTGALLSLCFELPGILANVSPEKLARLRDAGHLLGRLFQIADDMLDLADSEQQTGKDLFRDLNEGKITYPYLLLLREGTAEETALLSGALGAENPPVERILELANRNGLRHKVESDLEQMLVRMRMTLGDAVGDSSAREIIDFCYGLAYRRQ